MSRHPLMIRFTRSIAILLLLLFGVTRGNLAAQSGSASSLQSVGANDPAAAAEFRKLTLQDEHGRIPTDALANARAQIDAMRSLQRPDPITGRNGWTWLGPGNAQFYGGAGHAGSGKVLGGSPDGTLMMTRASDLQGWTSTFSGSGGYVAIDPDDANRLYGEDNYLALHRSLTGDASGSDWINGLYWNGAHSACKPSPYSIPDVCHQGGILGSANYVAPFILDPNDSNRLLAGGVSLWRSDDITTPNTASTGPSWASIKGPIAFETPISAIAVAPGNSDIIWVGYNNGDVFKTVNGRAAAPAWTQMDNGPTSLPNRYVTRITIDPSDANIVYVTFGGFSAGNIQRSIDGGTTWASVTGNGMSGVPALPVRDLDVDPSDPSILHAATELGVFTSRDAGATWAVSNDGLTNVPVDELFFMGPELVAVTHGIGMFMKASAGFDALVAVTGQVTSAASPGGLSNVWVQFYMGNGAFVGSAPTNASGNYTMNLEPGTYYARTWNNQGYINEVYDNNPCVSSCIPQNGFPIVVGAGGASGINFFLDPGGRITGNVTNRTNGQPIQNISVDIFSAASMFGEYLGRGFTNASGDYITEMGLAPGNYFARTSNGPPIHFIDRLYNDIECLGCNVTTGAPIAVSGTATTGNINFALDPGGRIGGQVTAEGGGALANINVNLYNSSGIFVSGSFTDASGNYHLPAVHAGTYYARTFNSGQHIDELYNNIQCLNCTVTTGTPIPISVGGFTNTIDFALALGGNISGRVTDAATSVGLANVNVNIYNSSNTFVGSGWTDASGNYASGGLPAGTYYARTFNTAGFVDELHNNIVCVSCTATTGTPIAVTAGSTTTIDFALNAGGRISGSVTNASGGAGLANVNVQFYNSSGTFVGSKSTDASGNYTSPGLPGGNHYVRTQNSLGFVDKLYNGFTCVSCTVTTGTPVAVTTGVTTSNINFSLSAGGLISGTVTNQSTGAGIQNVIVQILNSTGQFVVSRTTDASGNYTTPALPVATYYARTQNSLGFLNKLYNNLPCSPFCTVTTGSPINVNAGATTSNINFALVLGGRIAGRVTNQSNGVGLANVNVTIYNAAGGFFSSQNTDASGNYITTGLPAGNYYATTSNSNGFLDELYNNLPCPGFCNVTTGAVIAVAAGATTNNIDFALMPGGLIAGRVTNESTGAGLFNVSVDIFDASGQFLMGRNTDASGNYTTSGLATGTYYARTSNNSYGLVDELYNNFPCPNYNCDVLTGTPITVTVGATASNINFALAAGGRISGTVSSTAALGPLEGAFIEIYDSTGTFVVAEGETDASGNYTSSIMVAGTYYARTWNGAGLINKVYNDIPCTGCVVTIGTPITVTAGNTTPNINFTLSPGGRIAGQVTAQEGGGPLEEIGVGIFTASGAFATYGYSDASGNYITFDGLPTGSYFARTFDETGNMFVDELWDNHTCVGECDVTAGNPISVTSPATTGNINFALAAGGGISGTVTRAVGGTPIANAQVDFYNNSGFFLGSEVTNAAGVFQTSVGVPGGTYYVRASAPGHVAQLYNNINCPSCPITSGTAVTVTAGAVTPNINFALVAGGRLSGRVTNASTGAGLGPITVDVYNSSGTLVTSPFSDASGNYTTVHLPGGTYYARTSNSLGYANILYNNIPCPGSCTVTSGTAITVTPPTTTPNINFALSTSAPATMLTPAPGSTLPGTSATFTWTSGSGLSDIWLSVGTTAGGNTIYNQSQGTATSRTVPGLPTDGTTVFVRLWSLRPATGWTFIDYTYVAADHRAALVLPASGGTLPGASANFQWTTGGASATSQWLSVGTSVGAGDIYSADQGTATMRTVSGLPTTGATVHVRLWTLLPVGWRSRDYSFPSSNGTLATMTSPANGSTLTGTTVTFNWTIPGATSQVWLYVGTSVGTFDIFTSNMGTATSQSVPNLPTNGAQVFVRLWSLRSGVWQYVDYNYRAVDNKAQLWLPAANGTLPGATATFKWTAGIGVTNKWLYVGTTLGGSDLYNAAQGAATERTVSGLPINGSTVYVRLWSFIGGAWVWNDYSFRAYAAPLAAMTSPANGSILNVASVTFTWTNAASASTWLAVGSTVGGTQFFNASTGTGTSQAVTGLPTDGSSALYARLWTLQGGVWQFIDYHYNARAKLVTPAEGGSAPGATAMFRWTPGAGVTNKWLYVGTTYGGSNLYNVEQFNATEVQVNGLPTTGVTLYARLWSLIDGVWSFTDSTFKAFDPSMATMTSPADGTTLAGSSVTFTWNRPAGTTQVWLYVGTTIGGYSIYSASEGTGTSRLVTGLPTNGSPVYVRLWSLVGGAWKYIDYRYTASGGLMEVER